MTTTNRLCYTVSKRYIQAGTTFEINVKILLADDCKNNICDWSITADIYEQRKNGRFVWCAGGCCHEEILKRFPQFKMFVDLHCLIITARQCIQLKTVFTILRTAAKKLQLTICVSRKRNIICFIRQKINNTLNTSFICSVSLNAGNKPENERFTLKLTDEERTTITNRINDGYYRPEAVQARKDEEKRKAYEKKRAEIINDCKKKQQKAENEKRVMLAVLDAGLSVNNVIYYDHSNELVFNWKDYETKVTENDFNKFVSSVNRSLLPAGITFKMK